MPSHLDYHTQQYHTATGQRRQKKEEQRVDAALLAAGFQRWDGPRDTAPPPMHFVREFTVDFRCLTTPSATAYARVDFVLSVDGTRLYLLEVDEHQHAHYEVECEQRRMLQVYESLLVGGNTLPVTWLRYNPHAHRVSGARPRVSKAEREAQVCAWLRAAREADAGPLTVAYAYYDKDAAGDVAPLVTTHPGYRGEVRALVVGGIG